MLLNTECQVPLNPFCSASLYTTEMSIGSRVRQIRQQMGLSQERFGEICGVTKGMVSQWESNIVTPPIDRMVELHKHFDFSYDWLINGKMTIATEIEQGLGVQERRAWYRAGRALAEPDDGTNGKQ